VNILLEMPEGSAADKLLSKHHDNPLYIKGKVDGSSSPARVKVENVTVEKDALH